MRQEVLLRSRGSDTQTLDEVVKREVYSCVASSAGACGSVIDLGANIGLASLYFAHRFPECRVLAVEPNIDTYALLRTNVRELVDSGRCRTLNAAVWSSNRNLVGCEAPGQAQYDSFMVKAPPCNDDGERIAGMTMQAIIAESGFDVVDLLKVDVEGAEIELFRGDVEWLRQVNMLAIEFHGDARRTTSFDELMAAFNFRIETDSHTVLATKHPVKG
jgi:FkbM family methyltransferase